jgi:hypothetical protein
LVRAGPEAATVAAVAAEAASSFLKGTAESRQAAAVALGPEGFAAVLRKVRRWFAHLVGCIGCTPPERACNCASLWSGVSVSVGQCAVQAQCMSLSWSPSVPLMRLTVIIYMPCRLMRHMMP